MTVITSHHSSHCVNQSVIILEPGICQLWEVRSLKKSPLILPNDLKYDCAQLLLSNYIKDDDLTVQFG